MTEHNGIIVPTGLEIYEGKILPIPSCREVPCPIVSRNNTYRISLRNMSSSIATVSVIENFIPEDGVSIDLEVGDKIYPDWKDNLVTFQIDPIGSPRFYAGFRVTTDFSPIAIEFFVHGTRGILLLSEPLQDGLAERRVYATEVVELVDGTESREEELEASNFYWRQVFSIQGFSLEDLQRLSIALQLSGKAGIVVPRWQWKAQVASALSGTQTIALDPSNDLTDHDIRMTSWNSWWVIHEKSSDDYWLFRSTGGTSTTIYTEEELPKTFDTTSWVAPIIVGFPLVAGEINLSAFAQGIGSLTVEEV